MLRDDIQAITWTSVDQDVWRHIVLQDQKFIKLERNFEAPRLYIVQTAMAIAAGTSIAPERIFAAENTNSAVSPYIRQTMQCVFYWVQRMCWQEITWN